MLMMNYTCYRTFHEECDARISKAHNAVVGLSTKIADLFSTGIISGQIHDELLVYRGYVDNAATFIKDVQDTMKSLIANYLDDMNDAQRIDKDYILYEKDYPDTRDYTKANFEKIARDCDSTDHDANLLEQINDWGEDITAKVLKFLGKTFNWFNARQTRFLVMEINDITKRRLKEIQLRIDHCEAKYTAKAETLYYTIWDLNQYLHILKTILTWNNGEFSASHFSHKINELYNRMTERLKEVNVESFVSPEDIMAFLALEHPENFFKGTSEDIYSYLEKLAQTDWTDWDFHAIWLTQMFEIASQKVKELFSNYTYEQFVMDREMLSLLDEMAERESLYEGTDKEKTVSTMEKLLELVKKYGNEWGNHLNTLRDENGNLLLDKRTKEYKAFKAFFDLFGNAAKVLDYSQDIVKIITKFLADYEKCEQILVTLEEKCINNPEMAASLARIRNVYENSIGSLVSDIYGKILDRGFDHIEKHIDEILEVGIFKVVGLIEMGIDIVGSATGISEDAAAKLQLLQTGYDQMNSAKAAFESALMELQNCSPEDAGYAECMKKFEHCFEYYRVTQKRLYAQMGKAENGLLGEYYRYCAEELGGLSLNNFEDFKLLTFEEYQQLGS